MALERMYNAPDVDGGGTPSTVGPQMVTYQWIKKALIEKRKEEYFGQLADVTSMPKHMGKTIKKYHYLPLLDDANINDQGIDAAGATIVKGKWQAFNAAGVEIVTGTGWVAPANGNAGYFSTEANAFTAAGVGGSIVITGGNLYGSSKDVGAISGKLPVLSETGGRVNRVGFKRIELEGSIEKMGFFDEYTQESMDFDSDADLQMHVSREMLNGAMEITEDALQIDLLNSAGVMKFAGGATSNVTIVDTSLVTYGDLLRLAIDLDNNRCPKHTKVITGTRMIDTKTISAGRVLYCGTELQPTLEAMTDLHGNQAFIPVQHYAAGATLLNGEIGSIGQFRIVIVPEMAKWAGAGGDASATATHYETNSKYDVFPMLVVGDESFTTIGFQTDGKTVKFKIMHKAPGEATADRTDPYGETGFMSIKWYYGFLLQRPERIGLIKTAATL
jgi:N4-gp56 family major capsid protein